MGQELGSAAVNNIWVPDGSKDIPVDRFAARQRLEASIDEMIATPYDKAHMRDAVESKLFGIGVEAMTVGSHEFYLGYAIRNKTVLCLDMGHFHPTENIADKLSAVALSVDELLLHVSRPMRWDSDHVILLNDDIFQMAQELVFADLLGRTHIGLDFFDATISRTAAWVIGTRNMQKALMRALLLPQDQLKQAEEALDFTTRLVLTEELKDLPFAAVWAEFCARMDAPVGHTLIADLDAYQASVAATRIGGRHGRVHPPDLLRQRSRPVPAPVLEDGLERGQRRQFLLAAADRRRSRASSPRHYPELSPDPAVPMPIDEPDLDGEYFLVTGSGQFFRHARRAPQPGLRHRPDRRRRHRLARRSGAFPPAPSRPRSSPPIWSPTPCANGSRTGANGSSCTRTCPNSSR